MNGPVRPYVITGGRSRPSRNVLALESLVSTVPGADTAGAELNREHRRILTICERLLAVAEIAAHLHLPLSVVKVLIGDLWDLGAVHVLPPATAIHRSPDVPQAERLPAALLEEVLVGLRQLR